MADEFFRNRLPLQPVDVAGTAFASPRNRLLEYFTGPPTGPEIVDPQAMGADRFILNAGGTGRRESDLMWDEALMSDRQRAVGNALSSEPVNRMMMLANFLAPGAKPQMPRPAAGGVSLPMDSASRAARAAEQGYRPVYHGTSTQGGKLFTEFDPARTGGRVSGSRSAQEGVSVSFSPEIANEYAMRAAQQTGGDPAVLPLMYRTERPASLRLDGTEKNLEVAATLNDAFRGGGYDSVLMKNYSTPGGITGENIAVVANPNQLRSVQAAFDPSKKSSANLMASRLAPFLFGSGAAYELSNAQRRNRLLPD